MVGIVTNYLPKWRWMVIILVLAIHFRTSQSARDKHHSLVLYILTKEIWYLSSQSEHAFNAIHWYSIIVLKAEASAKYLTGLKMLIIYHTSWCQVKLTSLFHFALFICHVGDQFSHAVCCSCQKYHHLWGHVTHVVTGVVITFFHESSEIRRVCDKDRW